MLFWAFFAVRSRNTDYYLDLWLQCRAHPLQPDKDYNWSNNHYSNHKRMAHDDSLSTTVTLMVRQGGSYGFYCCYLQKKRVIEPLTVAHKAISRFAAYFLCFRGIRAYSQPLQPDKYHNWSNNHYNNRNRMPHDASVFWIGWKRLRSSTWS